MLNFISSHLTAMLEVAKKRSASPEIKREVKRHQSDPPLREGETNFEQLVSLLEWEPKASFVTLDKFWAQATSLRVLRYGFYWNTTSWLAPRLPRRLRLRIRHAVPRCTRVPGTFCFGATHRASDHTNYPWTLYFVFPERDTDLVEDEPLTGRFHDEVLLKAFEKSGQRAYNEHAPYSWEDTKIEAQKYVKEYFHQSDVSTLPVDACVFPRNIDVDQFWQAIQDGINDDRSFGSTSSIPEPRVFDMYSSSTAMIALLQWRHIITVHDAINLPRDTTSMYPPFHTPRTPEIRSIPVVLEYINDLQRLNHFQNFFQAPAQLALLTSDMQNSNSFPESVICSEQDHVPWPYHSDYVIHHLMENLMADKLRTYVTSCLSLDPHKLFADAADPTMAEYCQWLV
ncbi:hypothetical protein LTR17_006313 [Elasticomyces elasticus]|nr:hypothetical protein LTR17_006313 [Elasticomyces elasticus]